MDQKAIMLSKISQTQKDKYYMYFFYHMQNLDFKIVRLQSREYLGRVKRLLERRVWTEEGNEEG